ncbi:hypothetical protein BOTBODRAFT_182137 [Botryobasidium botryosum FD-172 SS1]|uniref:Uncharacterized protein n=1 Tax=Botryobasidium botryosum (strain FD-172 SS1) TaxID=930990 RepID=A0A067LS95_BOTB1|nr:hypothetical protein BOTBODRAFT_182137 [Botryobasidium botryosum FD-172 SS1]
MPFVKRHIHRRLASAKDNCDKELDPPEFRSRRPIATMPVGTTATRLTLNGAVSDSHATPVYSPPPSPASIYGLNISSGEFSPSKSKGASSGQWHSQSQTTVSRTTPTSPPSPSNLAPARARLRDLAPCSLPPAMAQAPFSRLAAPFSRPMTPFSLRWFVPTSLLQICSHSRGSAVLARGFVLAAPFLPPCFHSG